MDEETLKLLSRIRKTTDGVDLLEYLYTLSRENYQAFKRDRSEMNDIHKGYALAIDSLIQAFETAGDLLKREGDPKLDRANWGT